MGQASLSLALSIGAISSGEEVFPGQEIDIASTTTPSPKPSQVRFGQTRNLSSPNAFVTLSGVGPSDTVTKANLVYIRTTSPMRVRVTYQDLPSDLVSVFFIQGTYLMEVPDSNPVVLLEAQGSGFIEYAVSGNQLRCLSNRFEERKCPHSQPASTRATPTRCPMDSERSSSEVSCLPLLLSCLLLRLLLLLVSMLPLWRSSDFPTRPRLLLLPACTPEALLLLVRSPLRPTLLLLANTRSPLLVISSSWQRISSPQSTSVTNLTSWKCTSTPVLWWQTRWLSALFSAPEASSC